MSAYVVNPKTINRFLSFLQTGNYIWLKKELYEKTDFNLKTTENVQDLGQALYNMNINAVSQRYAHTVNEGGSIPGSYDDNDNLLSYKFKYNPVGLIQALKSLQCYLYQCSEGNVEEQSLFKVLHTIKNHWIAKVIRNLPEYEKAEWD